MALRVGTRLVVTVGLLLMGGGLVVAAFNSEADTAYFGPIIVAMVLLALGLSSITAPTAEAVMGSVSDEQRGAAAGVNNTTRELGGTLGVAVFGSIFASSYAPRIISAFRPLPIPAGPKAEAHQSMAAALAVVGHAPRAAQPALQSITFTAFHSGLQVACIAGAGVAVLGALAAVQAPAGAGCSGGAAGGRSPPRIRTAIPSTCRTSRPRRAWRRLGRDRTDQPVVRTAPGLGSAGRLRLVLREDQLGVPDAGDHRARRPLDRCRPGTATRSGPAVGRGRTRPSRRARAAPRQKCGPNPKLTCGLGWRSTRSSPASGPNTSSSRLAEA